MRNGENIGTSTPMDFVPTSILTSCTWSATMSLRGFSLHIEQLSGAKSATRSGGKSE